MREYKFNPHRHVKIWLSKIPSVFLGIQNQMRLAAMRGVNPEADIYFVYDKSLLLGDAFKDLEEFCERYRITPKDIHQDIFPLCQSETEQTLVALCKEEITERENGGNLAAASDILRWLEPVYTPGIYSDFDVSLNTSELPPTISVSRSMLLPINSSLRDSWSDFVLHITTQETLEKATLLQRIILNCAHSHYIDGSWLGEVNLM